MNGNKRGDGERPSPTDSEAPNTEKHSSDGSLGDGPVVEGVDAPTSQSYSSFGRQPYRCVVCGQVEDIPQGRGARIRYPCTGCDAVRQFDRVAGGNDE